MVIFVLYGMRIVLLILRNSYVEDWVKELSAETNTSGSVEQTIPEHTVAAGPSTTEQTLGIQHQHLLWNH